MDSTRRPLHVAIGVLAGVIGGPASYGRHLVRALGALGELDTPGELADLEEPLRVTVLTDRPDAFAGLRCAIAHVPMRGGIDRLRWQHVAVPRALRRLSPDVYHDTKNALPRGLTVPAVVTIHDLACRAVPESFGPLSRLFLQRATRDAVRRAQVVLVPSQATAADVHRWHPEAASRLAVVPHGIEVARGLDGARFEAARARLALPARYVLHVGTIQARKNVDLVIRAVRALRAVHPDLRAVLVGRRGWLARRTFAEIARDDTARWLGVVSDDDLAAAYRGATAFVSPSAYEGFGFTVGDALAAGVPTVISDGSSLPEVCGDAALRLAALDVESIRAALASLLADPGLAAELRQRGPRRAAEFTWRRAALGHLDAYRRAAARAARGGGAAA